MGKHVINPDGEGLGGLVDEEPMVDLGGGMVVPLREVLEGRDTIPVQRTEPADEALKTQSAPERYRAEVRHRRGWAWEVDLITTHTILPVIKRVRDEVEYDDLVERESRLEHPPTALGERWARWKARRMVAAAYRRDVREGQPWVVER